MSRLSLLRLVPLLAVFGLFALNYQLDYDFLLTKPRYTTSGLPYSPIKSGPFNPDLDWLVFVHIQVSKLIYQIESSIFYEID